MANLWKFFAYSFASPKVILFFSFLSLDIMKGKMCKLICSVGFFGIFFFSGCSLLIGNVRPLDEKAVNYSISDLSKKNPNWKKLESSNSSGPLEKKKSPSQPTLPSESGSTTSTNDLSSESDELSDIAFQSSVTASIISLNSACRKGRDHDQSDLKTLTRLLFLGILEIKIQEEKMISLQGIDGLQTTVTGNLNQEEMMLQTIVFKKKECLFDLLFLSRPHHYHSDIGIFNEFVASLQLK